MKTTSKKVLKTRIKFMFDEITKTHIAFITKDENGNWRGCRENNQSKKKIVIPSKEIAMNVKDNILYQAVLINMDNDKGFIAKELEIIKFPATIETTIEPERYKVEVRFGNKKVIYDPQNGRQESRKTLPGVMNILKNRVDIENKEQVLENFYEIANQVLTLYIEYKKTIA